MAKTEVGLKLAVDAKEASEYLKKLKSDLKIAEGALLAIRDKFGETSKEAIQAGRVVADLRDKIQGAKEQANLFDPGKKFQAFTTAATQLAAGFSAVQGAMALVGSESEDVQKGLLKVQGAIALTQGLSELKDVGKSFEQLNTVIQSSTILQKANAVATNLTSGAMKALGISVNTTSTSFKVLRTAIIATGIGALVVALGFAVEALMNLADSSDEATKAQKKLEKAQRDAAAAIEMQNKMLQDQISLADRNTQVAIKRAQAAGKSEAEITNITRDGILKRKKLLEDDLANRGTGDAQYFKKLEDLRKVNNELEDFDLDQQIKRTQELQRIREEQSKKAEDKRQKDKEKRKQDAEDEKKRQEEIQKNTEENLKNNAKRTKDLENQLRLARITDEKERLKVETQIKLQDELDAETERFKSGELRLEQYLINLALIRQRYAAEDKARQETDKLAEDERTAAARENTLQQQKELNDQIVAAEVELQNRKFEAAQSGLDLLSSLAGQNEQLANVIFAVQKGLEIGRIITDTARGIVAAKAGLAAVPPFLGPLPNPAFAVAAGIAAKQIVGLKVGAAASIASIAAASISKFKNGGGGGAAGVGGGGISTAAPVAPALAPQVEATQVNTAAVNQMGNRAARAYVLNSDIQNEQQRNAYIDRNASIGNP